MNKQVTVLASALKDTLMNADEPHVKICLSFEDVTAGPARTRRN